MLLCVLQEDGSLVCGQADQRTCVAMLACCELGTLHAICMQPTIGQADQVTCGRGDSMPAYGAA